MALVSLATLLAEIWRDKAARKETLDAAAAIGRRFEAPFLVVAERVRPGFVVGLGYLADLKIRIKRIPNNTPRRRDQ